MRKFASRAAVALALGIGALVSPAHAVPAGTIANQSPSTGEFIFSPRDGDESKFFFNKSSLVDNTDSATFFGSTPDNTTADNVDVSTIGTISDLGNGFGTIKGTDTGNDLLTSLTFTPTTGTTFDGMFIRGQLGGGGNFDGIVHVHIVGVDSSVTDLLVTGIKKDKDFGDIGIEAFNDTDLIASLTITTDSGTFFREVKQLEFSGVNGIVPVPEAPTIMIAGFMLVLGAFAFRRNA